MLTGLRGVVCPGSRSSVLWLRAASLCLPPAHHQRCCPGLWQGQGAQRASVKLYGSSSCSGCLILLHPTSSVSCHFFQHFSSSRCSPEAWIWHYYLASPVPARAVTNPEEGHCHQHLAVQPSWGNGGCPFRQETSKSQRREFSCGKGKEELWLSPSASPMNCVPGVAWGRGCISHCCLVAVLRKDTGTASCSRDVWSDLMADRLQKNECEVFVHICKYFCWSRMKNETMVSAQMLGVLTKKIPIPMHQLKCFISVTDWLFMGFIL